MEYAGIPSQLGMLAFYDRFLEKMRDEDVRSSLDDVEFGGRHQYEVFEELKSASENHLQAFKNNLRRY